MDEVSGFVLTQILKRLCAVSFKFTLPPAVHAFNYASRRSRTRDTVKPEIQKKGDWKRPPTPYVKGLTSGEALRVIIALANNYMEDCAIRFCIPGF